MSATIPETMLLSDLLKPTGYDCPQDLQDKTFAQSTSGGSEVVLENNKEVSITENGTIEITPSEGKDAMKKVTATVNVSSGGGSATAYAWKSGDNYSYYDFSTAPADQAAYETHKCLEISTTGLTIAVRAIADPTLPPSTYARITALSFTLNGHTISREPSKDFTLWG